MKLQLSARKATGILAFIAIGLSLVHIGVTYLHLSFDNRITEVFIEKFSLEEEGNFPSFFSAVLLLVAAGSFLVISQGTSYLKDNRDWKYWLGLVFVFVFLSLDEATQLHEKLDTDLIWSSYDATGLLAWPWVIIYAALVTIFAVLYLRFWLRFSRQFRIYYVLAAVVYVGSALGFEMLEALVYTTRGGYTLTYIILTSVEEMLEMAAITFLIYTNLRYITVHFSDLNISFAMTSQRTGA